jgi:hypothetical protein
MLKKIITYEDYNGVQRTEPFYFNMTEAEMMELELGTEGTFTGVVQKIIDTQDTPKLMKYFKELIMLAYGEKSADGKRFIKSKELSEAFTQSPAYSELVMEFFNDSNAASDFVNGLAPKGIDQAKLAEARKEVESNFSLSSDLLNEDD